MHYIDIEIVVVMIDGRDGVEDVIGKRNVAREKVESTDECFGVLLFILALLFMIYHHGYGAGEYATVPFSYFL